MENASSSINLVKKNDTASFDKFIDWALSIGRLIVIITEIIAIAAFVYRFSLDEKIVRLHGDIKQKQKQLSFLKKDEANFRNLHDRLDLASKFSEEGTKAFNIFQDLVNITPEELKYDDLTIRNDRITLGISITSIPSLTEFVKSLKNHKMMKSVSIDNIEHRPETGLSVAITALVK